MQRLATPPTPAPDHATLSAAALTAFFNLAERWGLTAEQARTLLGSPPHSTFFNWKRRRRGLLTRDTLERVSYLLGIYKALHILLPSPQAADTWVHKPNTAPLFGGRSALDKMLGGNVADLADVRRYLDAERG
jgi:hypothetical protein